MTLLRKPTPMLRCSLYWKVARNRLQGRGMRLR